jgi:DNA segregation ATPase FtsK/SpoIIIE, S-DNA-T family
MAERIRRIKEEVAGVVSLMGSVYLLLILTTHNLRDPVLFFRTTEPLEQLENLGGIIGAYLSGWLFITLGLSAFSIPVFIIVFGIKRLMGRERYNIHLLGSILFIPSFSLLLSLLEQTLSLAAVGYPDGLGGLIGKTFASVLISLFSVPGAYIFSLSLLLPSLILISPVSVTAIAVRRRRRDKKSWEPGQREEAETETETEEKPADYRDILVKEPDPSPVSSAAAGEGTFKARKIGDYEFPSLDLLNLPDSGPIRPSNDELFSESSLIEKKLDDFGVTGNIVKVTTGPIVTMFEFEPAPGVKINKIVSLADDLALALKAQSVRISAITGKSAIGIEVPNKQRDAVLLREILSYEGFQKSRSKLTIGLGKDISGTPVVADLAKMPHLLVAGATGSGKSVSINSMVMSILYKAAPGEVKMLMVDPKLLELSAYEDIPHLITPVITGPREAAEALRKMVVEMERRYRVLAERAARSIDNFNFKVKDEEQMPYIIIIIDELADLMFTAPADVEDSITRLAQMGRAAGIHLILATQRPSVDVITGIIKANFPARISFQVTSKVDSRTILDSQGAEQLLGKGDMLVMLPGTRVMRVHGALVTEGEIRAVTEFVKTQGKPDYSIIESIQSAEAEEDERFAERDEMYLKAVELGEGTGEVSISSIQRRLKIGYNRAARIMELMEEDGLVGPPKGAGKPRDFLRRRR